MRKLRILLLVLMLSLLSGCWSANNIQNIVYSTALGIDYDGKTFTIYAQIINFDMLSVGGEATGTNLAGMYVGKGAGETIASAAVDLYKTAQSQIDWGHVAAVVITERAMKSLDNQVTRRIMRYPENRYNSWFYITKDPIDEIFQATSFFNQTSIYTILHNPLSAYHQHSLLPPILLFRFIANVNEPDRIVYLPCIGFDKKQWQSKDANVPQLMITGAYFSDNQNNSVIIPKESAQGYRWMDKKMGRTLLDLKDKEKVYGNVALKLVKLKVKPYLEGDEVKFNISLKYAGGLHEYVEEMSYTEMTTIINKNIEQEIKEFYLKGVEEGLDVYSLMHHFRMKYPDQWKSMTNNGNDFVLSKNSITKLNIQSTIIYSGKYKRQL